ncbi:ABC transporter permease subunit (plasmid) [Paroceanicella profunda]|uniref:ABC transporter permease subunit n=1 Tax=Paroceanicella profunda TaxID=2579971 RepID=A0A5B8FJP9_9RHOB|nr:ABC transporter permease subunit [Paroceanicella profunda]
MVHCGALLVLSIASVLQGVDRRLEESAQTLGAGRLRTFFEVTLPLSLDGWAPGRSWCS